MAKVKDDDENGHAIIDRLIRIDEADNSRADWRTLGRSLKGKHLTASQRNEGMLRHAQAMRDAGVLNEIASHYLISQFVDFIVEHRIMIEQSSPALDSISERRKEAERRHGLPLYPNNRTLLKSASTSGWGQERTRRNLTR